MYENSLTYFFLIALLWILVLAAVIFPVSTQSSWMDHDPKFAQTVDLLEQNSKQNLRLKNQEKTWQLCRAVERKEHHLHKQITMSAFDLTNQSTRCTKPEMDCVFPRMKLRDETFTFIDGKWVNEVHCQPTFAPQRRLLSKKSENEWSIWEENRALWEENQVLRIENRMLWEENKALQYLQSQNKGVQLVYSDTIQQSLQKDHKLSPFFPERHLGFQVSPGKKGLQLIRERNSILEFFHKQNRTVPSVWKDQQAITVHEENKGDSTVQKATECTTAVGEGSLDPTSQEEHDAKEESTTPTQNDTKTAPSTEDDNEILQALQDLYQILQVFLKEKCLPDDGESLHTLQDEKKFFQEEYKKLKLQLNNVKNTVSDITTQMEMLEKELIAITFPIYEEAGKNTANEFQLGEI